MGKLKVLITSHRSYPHIGGIEMHIHWISKFLSEETNKNIEILHLATDISETSTTKYNNSYTLKRIKALHLDNEIWPLISPNVAKEIQKIVQEFNPTIIHTHNRFSPLTRYMTKISRREGIPLIHTEHSSTYDYTHSKAINKLFKSFDKTFIKNHFTEAKAITAVSLPGAELLEKNWDLPKVHITENFITPSHILKFKKDNRKNNKLSILFVGRLTGVKGYNEFLELIQSPNKSIDYSVTIIGDGPGRDKVRKIASIHPHINFLGRQSHNATLENMATHDVQVNFSHLEGLATTLMEGMTLGQTIIATDIIPNKILLEEYPGTVFIHLKSSQKDWDEAIIKANKLKDKDYSQEGLALVPTREKTAQKYLNLYNELS